MQFTALPRNYNYMQRPDLVPFAEIHSVLEDLAKGDIDVFGKLQPRLFRALPKIQKRLGKPSYIAMAAFSPNELVLLTAAAAATSRGLSLVVHGSNSSSSRSLPAYSNGLLCISRCCEAVIAIAALHTTS